MKSDGYRRVVSNGSGFFHDFYDVSSALLGSLFFSFTSARKSMSERQGCLAESIRTIINPVTLTVFGSLVYPCLYANYDKKTVLYVLGVQITTNLVNGFYEHHVSPRLRPENYYSDLEYKIAGIDDQKYYKNMEIMAASRPESEKNTSPFSPYEL